MISVCMASFNGAEFIGEQLHSILSQLDAADEVIISDDGSTDNTVKLIEELGDSRIKLVRNTGPKGIVPNIENALTRVRGDVVFLADQDDVWENHKVRVMTEYLKTYDLVVSDCRIIDRNGCETGSSYYSTRNSGRGLVRNFLRNTYMGCCMAFSAQLLTKAIPFPRHLPMHDWWIGLIGEISGNIFFCPEKLVRYRRHSGNQTPLAGESRFSLKTQLVWRMTVLTSLVLSIKRLNQ